MVWGIFIYTFAVIKQDGTFVPPLPAHQGYCVVLCYDAIRRASSYDPNLILYEVYESSTLLSRRYVHLELKQKNHPNNNKVVFRHCEHFDFVLAGENCEITYLNIF